MKKALLFLTMLALSASIISCGSGGAGPANTPTGVNPGISALVQLTPGSYVAQTYGSIALMTKVLDGNGMPVRNVPVKYTNLSMLGVLSSTSANTDSLGVATVTLYSAASGFATIEAQVDSGTTVVRDQKTVYFSTYSMTLPPSSATAPPYIVLEVDGNNNGIFNETSDLTLFKISSDTERIVRATVVDGSTGAPIPNISVTFGADRPYKIGSSATCSDGSALCDVSFPTGNVVKSNSSGQASVLMQVSPAVLTSLTTTLNVTASGSNSAAGIMSLFLNPVTISSISVTASPSIVQIEKPATIIAGVKTSMNGPAPNGTTVNFSTNCGQLTSPFSQTNSGSATTTFNAPSSPTICQVSATSGAITASAGISVVPVPVTPPTTTPAPLAVVPGSVTILSSASDQTVSFSISGGSGSYTTTSSDPAKAYNGTLGSGVWTGSTVTVTIPANVAAGTVTLGIFDTAGATVSATIMIQGGAGGGAGTLSVSPSSITLAGTNTASDQVTFTVAGGTAPYTVLSDNTAVIPNPTVSGTSFTINPNPVAVSTNVTLTIMDSHGATKTMIVMVTPATASLAINPSTVSMKAGGAVTFNVIGGTGGPLTIVSGNTAIANVTNASCTTSGSGVLNCPSGTTSFTVTGIAASATPVTITVIDVNGGVSATSSVTVN